MATEQTKKKIVEAFLELLETHDFASVRLDQIAAKAGVTLGTIRESYDGKLSILADFVRRTDRTVLDAEGGKIEGETARDRLFELVMRRLDTVAPHKAALVSLERSARRDRALALCLNRIALDSARFMLAGAGVGTGGWRGAARAQGFVLLTLRVLAVWKDDNEPDLSKTMSKLDHELDRAEGLERRADRLIGAACKVARKFERRRPHRRHRDETAEAPAS
mgnify:CR=1 FL=1